MGIRVLSLFLAFLLFASPLVIRGQSGKDGDVAEVEGGELGIVDDDAQIFTEGTLSSAPGVDIICLFPKNPARLVPAGEETELLVGIHNEVESLLDVIAIKASLHLPFDHRMFVQNLTVQGYVRSWTKLSLESSKSSPKSLFLATPENIFGEFFNATVPLSAQSTFPYAFAVSKFLQPGSFDLVGTVLYEIDQQPYQSVFYNGTIEVVEAGGLLSIESVFLILLGVALTVFFGVWAYNQIQHFSKRAAPKVEVGTRSIDADMDEWLQGTAYAQSLSSKSRKKK